jgi:outer membrane protein assembly factor BamE (lipoprotein component of BamABCDE complex)
MRVALTVIVAALFASAGCSYALHPHRTIEGRPFAWEAAESVKPGTTEAELLERLGKPLEILAEGPRAAVWHYHERAQLRGCRTSLFGVIPWGDTPVVTADARIYLRDGIVEKAETARRD